MTASLISEQVSAHLHALVPARPPELVGMEEQAAATDFPIIGPVAGHLCYLLARLVGARRVFELGSGFGYSTAWFARAVRENGGGSVEHVVWDEELSRQARLHLERLGYADLMSFHVGEAVAHLREAPGPYDLIFNDIEKDGYPGALPVIAQKLRPGGLLIADNALWHGRIFAPTDHSPATEGVREFTRMLSEDAAWTVSLLPVRDGLLIARRR
jgi:caffeoyl-CoA O-methyltransferase